TSLLALTTFSFQVTGGAKVTWTVDEGMKGGTVNDAGAYTAPLADGTYHVRATSVVDASLFSEATVTVSRLVTPGTITSAGMLSNATGHGSQSHLAFAEGSGEWWLFFDQSSIPALKTMHSKPFGTWQPGDQVSLPKGHSNDGRDLAVAYRRLNQHD